MLATGYEAGVKDAKQAAAFLARVERAEVMFDVDVNSDGQEFVASYIKGVLSIIGNAKFRTRG